MKRVLFSAHLWLAVLYLAGSGSVVAGVHGLAGEGAALIVAGAFVLLLCRFLLNGLRNG